MKSLSKVCFAARILSQDMLQGPDPQNLERRGTVRSFKSCHLIVQPAPNSLFWNFCSCKCLRGGGSGGGGLGAKSCPTLVVSWTVAHQAPLFMEFSRQDYWSGLPCPPPGDLLDPGIDPCLLDCRWSLALQAGSTGWATREVQMFKRLFVLKKGRMQGLPRLSSG